MDLYGAKSCRGVLLRTEFPQDVIFEGQIVMGQIVQKRIHAEKYQY